MSACLYVYSVKILLEHSIFILLAQIFKLSFQYSIYQHFQRTQYRDGA